jgi:DNA-binding NtrC family response regulator
VASGQFREDLYFRLNVVTITLPPLRERREEIPILTDHFLKKYSVQYNKAAAPVSADLARQFMNYEWPGNVRQLENLIKRMVVLGSESAIVKELQQPAATLPFRPLASPSSTPRAYVHTPPPPVRPPPAAAAAGLGRAAGAERAGGADDAMEAAVSAAVATTLSGASAPAVATSPSTALGASVSLKDIARTAAREAERELILRMLTRTRWNRKEAAEILGISYKALLYKIKESGLDKAS